MVYVEQYNKYRKYSVNRNQYKLHVLAKRLVRIKSNGF